MKTSLKVFVTAAILSVCLVELVPVQPAVADLRPPVELRMLGKPHAYVPGETYQGSFELVTELRGDFTSFHFEGNGWREKSLDAPTQIYLDKGARLVINFELNATANPGDLTFVYEIDGYTMVEAMDLSAKHLARMTSTGAVQPARDPATPAPAPANRQRPEPAVRPDSEKSDGPDPDEIGLVINRTIRVYGRFVYNRSGGLTMGADGVTVRVWDQDVFADDLLASVATDANGNYDININTSVAGENNPDLYIIFEAENSKVRLEDATWHNLYSWQTGTHNNYSGSALNFGSLQPAAEADHPSLNVLTDVTRTWRWLLGHEGYDTAAITCQWPDGATGAWYSSNAMHIGVDRQWNEATHSHEYGHHWISHYALSVTPDYCNGICDTSPTNCGHCIWCQETDHDAFAEGWPNWLADVLTRSYAGDYGVAPLVTRSGESLSNCGGLLDDPLLTEGFFGAVLRDIEDSTNDNHPAYPGVSDVMSRGTNEIFRVVDLDHPTTPLGFLNAFKSRYPNSHENLWETASNCGYNIDVSRPAAATNLTSSHATTGDSADPTVFYSWTTPSDDASGIAGYSVRIGATAARPDAVQDINDVRSYTTTALAPGTYYFNLRAVDRAGRWSSTYATYGPVTIRLANPSDLTYRTSATWDYPIVPRSAATTGAVTVSATLLGDSNSTYWNVIGKNQGESTTGSGFWTKLYVDDSYTRGWHWSAISAFGNFVGTNGGPFTVRGGRHTFEARYDDTDQVAEIDETNNVYAHQFIWSPADVTNGVPLTRTAPPLLTGGWSSVVDGQLKWYNCDGIRPTSLGWWNALVVRAVGNTDDYDIRLHNPTTGAENGFGTYLAFSSRAAGCLDAVLFNRNVTGSVLYNGGVLNWNSGTGDYVASHVKSSPFAVGDSTTVSFSTDEYLILKEFHVLAADTGYVSITVDVDPATGPLYVQWHDKFFSTGTLTTYNLQAVTDPATGRARLDFHVDQAGYNCLVMFRDPKDGSAPLVATVEIQPTPPDFMPYAAAGWHAPLVPHPLDDGSQVLVALPDSLQGNTASTYLNLAIRNDSPTANSPLRVHIYRDGVYSWWVSWGNVPGNANRLLNWHTPWTVPGGRHTLAMHLDPLDAVEEIWESNNSFGEQYVWSPLVVPTGTQVQRGTPPNATGGWSDISGATALWYNCDGLRLPTKTNWWQAMAVMPSVGTDVDTRLHTILSGATAGFGTNMAYSGWGPESSDFSLINYNIGAHTGYDAGVLKISGSGGYSAENVGSQFLGTDPSGPSASFSLPAGRLLNLHEVRLTPGPFAVHLIDESSDVDWGVSLMPADLDFMSKSQALISRWMAGSGQNEEINEFNVPALGYYCLAVWKVGTVDLDKVGSYHLLFGNRVSDVPGTSLPTVTGLRHIYPNPFNPQTKIVFDLAAPITAVVAIYDLHGRRVRLLANAALTPGRHEVIWNGQDDHGQPVASGVYMVRMQAEGYRAMRKVMLLK